MRNPFKLMSLVAAALLVASCSAGPTEQEINNSLEQMLRSVAGDWTGTSSGDNPVTLAFRVQEGSNGQVSGTGTMKEGRAASTVPITVTGTYRRPALSLTFSGMVYEGQSVQGVVQGQYTTVAGVGTTLQLTGTGYAKSIAILLQEK